MAADVLQQFSLSAVLDAFGNDLQLQSATKLHDGFDDAQAAVRVRHLIDKGLINFEPVDVEAFEVTE